MASKTAYGEISKQLKSYGLIENEDFFDGFKYLHVSVDTPGHVSRYIALPAGYGDIKTFDNTSRLVRARDEKKYIG